MGALRVFLCIISAFAAGCVTTNATMLGTATAHRASTNESVVRFYRTAEQVPGRYEEIALLHSKGDSENTSESQMYESMRRKAAEIGANGVILEALVEPSVEAKIAAKSLGVLPDREGRAVAIYVYPPGEGLERVAENP